MKTVIRHTLHCLLFFLVLSCTSKEQAQPPALALHAALLRSYDSTYSSGNPAIRKTFDVQLKVSNPLPQTVSFWIMSCSWQENFLCNREDFRLLPTECNKNVPKTIYLSPNDSLVFVASISYLGLSNDKSEETVKLGFIVLDSLKYTSDESFLNALRDKSQQDNISWSNPIKVQIK